MKRLSILALTAVLFLALAAAEEKAAKQPDVKEIIDQANRAQDKACRFFFTAQNPDGSWGDPQSSYQPAVTALAVTALANSPRKYMEGDNPHMSKAVEFILRHRQDDGSIASSDSLQAYNTSIAIMALKAVRNPTYDGVITKAVEFLKKMQKDEGEGLGKNDDMYGGWGYATKYDKADMSNTGMVLEALKKAGVPPTDPVFQKALTFVGKCQKNTQTNPIKAEWVSTDADGGFIYRPGESKAGGERKYFFGLIGPVAKVNSYGLMSYKGLLSMVYADIAKDDPRVASALAYVAKNYDPDNNVGLKKEGLYYYRMTLAKALAAVGGPLIETERGAVNWAADLATRLIAEQRDNFSWINKDSDKWEEDDAIIVTAYAMQTLDVCCKTLEKSPPPAQDKK